MSQQKKLVIMLVALVAVIVVGGGAYALTSQGVTPEADQVAASSPKSSSQESGTQGSQSSQGTSSDANSAKTDSEASDADDLTNVTAGQKPQNVSDLKVTTFDGTETTIKEIGDKPKYIAFWATWCPSCVKEAPIMQSLYEKYGDKIDFVIINEEGSTKAEFDKGRAWVTDNGYTYPTFYDETQDVGVALGIRFLPTTILTDKDGNILDGFAGLKSEEVLTQKLDALLS